MAEEPAPEPLFLAGADRSGIGLLGDVLDRHPQVAISRRINFWTFYDRRYGPLERTADGTLRHPVFLGLREDKGVDDIVRRASDGEHGNEPRTAAPKRSTRKPAANVAQDAKDTIAIGPGRITVSTVASTKGYDAPQVLLVSVDAFPDTVEGRVCLYVGCTRAREWLEATTTEMTGLAREFERSVSATNAEQ